MSDIIRIKKHNDYKKFELRKKSHVFSKVYVKSLSKRIDILEDTLLKLKEIVDEQNKQILYFHSIYFEKNNYTPFPERINTEDVILD